MTELLADRKEQNVGWNYHLNRNNILNKAIMESLRSQLSDKNLADLRTDVVPQAQIRIARKLSGVEPQVQKRNFPSVEQIQDSANELRAEGLT